MRVVAAAVVLALIAGAAARVADLTADPPRWLTTSYAPLVDGPWYLAAAGVPEDPALPPQYRLPILAAASRAVLAVAGAREATYALPSALAGALVPLALLLALRRAKASSLALAAAVAFVALDAVHIAWSRTGVPYPLLSLLACAAFALAAGESAGEPARRRRLWLAGAAALAIAGALGLKLIGLVALVPIAVLALPGPTPPRRILAAAAAAAALAGALLLLDPTARFRVRDYVGEAGPADLLRRLAHFPVASRLALLAPAAVLLGILAPITLRPLRRVEAALLAWTAAGALGLGLHARPDTPYVLAFWPAALALAALVAARIAEGGQPSLARPGLAVFATAGAIAFVALDAACQLGLAPWLGDRYWFAADRFARTLLAAAAAGGLVALVAGKVHRSVNNEAAPPRPVLAVLLVAAHIATQAVLVAGTPREHELSRARAEVRAILPRAAVLGEQFGHALALGDGRPVGARHSVQQPSDPRGAAALGVTHLAAAADRFSENVAPALRRAYGEEPRPIASLYVRGVRVRLAALPGALAAGPFELARARIDAGDASGAASLLASALTIAPESELIRAHLAFARALGGDLDGAASALPPESDDASIPMRLVRGYIAQARGDRASALPHFRAARARFSGARDLDRLCEDASARAELIVGDLLR